MQCGIGGALWEKVTSRKGGLGLNEENEFEKVSALAGGRLDMRGW